MTDSVDARDVRVPVLMYHRVSEQMAAQDRAYCVTPRQFAAHLDWLAAHGWRPCTVTAFERWYSGGAALPERSVLITFDDGFEGVYRHAFPLLAARGWPATVFLVSALVGRRDSWTTREFGAGQGHALLDRAQIADMAAGGIEFHSHTRTHANLTALDDRALAEQLQGSRAELEDMLGREVPYLAYPFGRADDRVRSAARTAGYRMGFSVDPGFNRPGGDTLAVRRLDITGRDGRASFGRKVSLGSNDGSLARQLRYLSRRIAARLSLA